MPTKASGISISTHHSGIPGSSSPRELRSLSANSQPA